MLSALRLLNLLMHTYLLNQSLMTDRIVVANGLLLVVC